MIALWLFYGCALGALLGLGALAIERVAGLLHAPTRWAWLGALVATVALPVTLALRPQMATPSSAVASVTQTNQLPSSSGAVVTSHRPPRFRAATLDSLTTPLLVAWALGAALLAGMLMRSWVAQRRARRRWRRIAVEGRQVLVAPEAGPAVVGVGRLEILMPEWAVAGDPTALRLMLRHEEQHVQARDPNLLLVAAAALVLMPWNLALWWLTRRLRLAIEVDCDGRVLRLGEDVHGYGSLLLEVASRCGGAVLLPGAAFSESATQLRRRIEAMSAPEPRRPILRACVFGTLCAAAVVLACASPRPQSIRNFAPAGQLFPAASALHRTPPVLMVTPEQMTAAIARYFPDVLRGDTGGSSRHRVAMKRIRCIRMKV
jgi:beta-lactamase regulating signal transducer with metallopeptidase domain